MQGEKPVLSEEGIRPAMVITTRSTEARTFFPLAQDRSQSPPNKTVNVSESRSMGLLEISEPALEDGIEFADHRDVFVGNTVAILFHEIAEDGSGLRIRVPIERRRR